MTYKSDRTFNLLADNPEEGISCQEITIYEDDCLNIVHKIKDLWSREIEYWQTNDGWLLKITPDNIQYFYKEEE